MATKTKTTKVAQNEIEIATPEMETEIDTVTEADDTEEDDAETGEENQIVNTLDKDDPLFLVVDTMITARNALVNSLGGKGQELDDLQVELGEIEQRRREVMETIQALRPTVGTVQMQIRNLETQIQSFKVPLTLQTSRGRGRPSNGGEASAPGEAFVKRGLEVFRDIAKRNPVFGNVEIQIAKGFNNNSAGGYLKKYCDAGVITRIENGKYQIADKYQ
jgi:hypothetical protein